MDYITSLIFGETYKPPSERMTGQLFTRDFGPTPTKDGRNLLGVTALVAVPPSIVIPFESMFPLLGVSHLGRVALLLDPKESKDIGEISRGHLLDGLLEQPIWRF